MIREIVWYFKCMYLDWQFNRLIKMHKKLHNRGIL